MTVNEIKQATPTWAENPSERLQKGFTIIRNTRMKAIPIVHPLVGVHAVGFHRWTHFWLGVMVTPWAINLILTEGETGYWKSVPEGQKLHYRFPAGLFDFISVKDALLGEYKMCSLISPLIEIKDDAMAMEVANAVLDELMKEEAPEEEGVPMESFTREIDADAVASAVEKNLTKPLSRRAFFRRSTTNKESTS